MSANAAAATTTVAMMPNMALPPSGIKQAILRCFYAKVVPMVTSSPGMGKSDIARELARELRLKLIDFRLAQADITDLNGLPEFVTDDKGRRRATFTPFDIFPLEGDELPDHPDGGKYDGWLIMCDELTSAIKQLQAAGYKLILDRMVGNHNIHEKVVMMGAGNLATDKAVVHTMSTALQSRLIHFELRCDHLEWMVWAHKNGVDERIRAFLEFKKEYLYQFDPDHEDKTFACPRTWWFAHKLIEGIQDLTDIDMPILAGTISTGIAIEFVQFCRIYKELPSITDIVQDPDKCVLPSEPSTKFAVAMMISERINATNAKELIQYLMRMNVEFQVVMARHLRIRDAKLLRHPAITPLFKKLGAFA